MISFDRTEIIQKIVNYEDDYKLSVFMVWYSEGKPGYKNLHKLLKSRNLRNKDDKIVSVHTLQLWIDNFKANAISVDEEVEALTKRFLAAEKASMLRRQADIGRQVRMIGLDALKEHGIKNASVALRAIFEGAKLEREASMLGEKVNFKNKTTEEIVQLLDDIIPTVIDELDD